MKDSFILSIIGMIWKYLFEIILYDFIGSEVPKFVPFFEGSYEKVNKMIVILQS